MYFSPPGGLSLTDCDIPGLEVSETVTTSFEGTGRGDSARGDEESGLPSTGEG